MTLIVRLLVLLGILAVSSSQTPTATLEGRLEFGDKTPFNITTRITLNNAEYTTYSRADGSFAIFNVPPGVHQLDVHSTQYHFGQVKVQLLPDAMDAPKCLEYIYPGANKNPIKYPLALHPYATYDYYEKASGMNVVKLLTNPMVIMMVFSVAMMVMMPMMMEHLDPEEKAKMKEQMEAQQNPTAMLSKMWGEISGSEEAVDPAQARRERRRVKK